MSNGLEVLGEGIACANPELKYVGANNRAVATVTIAFNRSVPEGNGKFRREATFMQCECWGKTAERLAKYLQKGSLVHVRGQVVQQNWEKDGQKRSKFIVGLQNFHVCEKQSGDGDGNGNGNGHGKPAPQSNGNTGDQAPPPSQPENSGPPSNPATEEELPF